MNNNRLLDTQLKSMLEKARRSLKSANGDIEEENYDFASSRAYYAAFYAIEAILLTKEVTVSKHSAVISAFNQYFIKTGIFPKEYSQYISRLFRNRQMGDYEFELSISKDEAQEDLIIAQKLINAISQYLINENLIHK